MGRHGAGVKVKARLYLEGRLMENAFDSITVSGGAGTPSTAEVNLVPTCTAKMLMAGTEVKIFTSDPMELNPSGNVDDFKLLFEGIIIGNGFARTSKGRMTRIQCAGPEVSWVEARQSWITLSSSAGGIIDQVIVQTSGGTGRFVMDEKAGRLSYLVGKLNSNKDDGEERFIDTLISVIDDIGGVNPLYANFKNRWRLTDRIVRATAGNTDKLFQLQILSGFFDGLAGRVSGQTNLSEVVNLMLTSIMHEWVSIPAPSYVNTRIFLRDAYGNIQRNKTKTNTERGGQRKQETFEFEVGRDDIVASCIFKPHLYTLSPPKCNILFPNMYEEVSFSRNLMVEPTRMAMRPQLFSRSLNKLTQGLLITRPSELEIFIAQTRDEAQKARGTRTPDALYADGAGQVGEFHDYDWATNEERIRGIVYNYANLGPAPGTLTLARQGIKQPKGNRSGGMTQYLQNVASYEYFRSRYQARAARINCHYNMRMVPGFTGIALDDSDAEQNLLYYVERITHHVHSSGVANTQIEISHPRYTNELDLSRPRFRSDGTGDAEGKIDLNLVRDPQTGLYDFERVFEGKARPPIPEWFSEEFQTLTGLDLVYKEFFGDQTGVLESILFDKEDERETNDSTTTSSSDAVSGPGATAVDNDSIDIDEAVARYNAEFRRARDEGREFDIAAEHTARNLTRIDQAFRFMGASPRELSDQGVQAPQDGVFTFENTPADSRTLKFDDLRFDCFVGDTSAGSGYTAIPEGLTENSRFATLPPFGTMSGAFPVFDTVEHTGDQNTDLDTRNSFRQIQGGASDYPRYDGRPLPHDFELRIWKESVSRANATVEDGSGRKRRVTSHTPAQQARTGDSLETDEILPLTQPLSEKQVIDLRRAIVDAYRDELRSKRGFRG